MTLTPELKLDAAGVKFCQAKRLYQLQRLQAVRSGSECGTAPLGSPMTIIVAETRGRR
jgi:hypothetical protein